MNKCKRILYTLTIFFSFLGCFGKEETVSFLKTMPAEKIREIRLEPFNAEGSLVKKDIVIQDRKKIAEIASLIRQAEDFRPDHPALKWQVVLRIISDREYGGLVLSSTERHQGVMLTMFSNVIDGWNYGSVRNDLLGEVLEKIAEQNGDWNNK